MKPWITLLVVCLSSSHLVFAQGSSSGTGGTSAADRDYIANVVKDIDAQISANANRSATEENANAEKWVKGVKKILKDALQDAGIDNNQEKYVDARDKLNLALLAASKTITADPLETKKEFGPISAQLVLRGLYLGHALGELENKKRVAAGPLDSYQSQNLASTAAQSQFLVLEKYVHLIIDTIERLDQDFYIPFRYLYGQDEAKYSHDLFKELQARRVQIAGLQASLPIDALIQFDPSTANIDRSVLGHDSDYFFEAMKVEATLAKDDLENTIYVHAASSAIDGLDDVAEQVQKRLDRKSPFNEPQLVVNVLLSMHHVLRALGFTAEISKDYELGYWVDLIDRELQSRPDYGRN